MPIIDDQVFVCTTIAHPRNQLELPKRAVFKTLCAEPHASRYDMDGIWFFCT